MKYTARFLTILAMAMVMLVQAISHGAYAQDRRLVQDEFQPSAVPVVASSTPAPTSTETSSVFFSNSPRYVQLLAKRDTEFLKSVAYNIFGEREALDFCVEPLAVAFIGLCETTLAYNLKLRPYQVVFMAVLSPYLYILPHYYLAGESLSFVVLPIVNVMAIVHWRPYMEPMAFLMRGMFHIYEDFRRERLHFVPIDNRIPVTAAAA